MEEKKDRLYTVGEFAKRAGITQRTLRYYDKIGLLKPSVYNESGYRLYTKHDFVRLQKILTLKFIGLSLNDIESIIKYDINDEDLKKSIELQRKIMQEKVDHIHLVMNALDEALYMLDTDKALNWDKFVNIINVINTDNKWMEQYQNASNLRARIKIHELFSTNKYGWMRWLFDKMYIPKNSRVLELGCGDGNLWIKNIDRIDESLDITLTDFSEGMLKDVKSTLKNSKHKFKFKIVDAQNIPFEDKSFDIVIANHMLYHVPDCERAFSEISRVLKKGGYFYASTVGQNHMHEMRDILSKFHSQDITTKSFDTTEKFQLENGMDKLLKWFKDVKIERYEDNLIITQPGPLIDYIFSMPGNIKDIFDSQRLKELYDFINNEIKQSKGIFITKNTGFFKAKL